MMYLIVPTSQTLMLPPEYNKNCCGLPGKIFELNITLTTYYMIQKAFKVSQRITVNTPKVI